MDDAVTILQCMVRCTLVLPTDLKTLRKCCKSFHRELAGRMPVTHMYLATNARGNRARSQGRLGPPCPVRHSVQLVQNILRVAGRIRRLFVTGPYLPHLRIMPQLKEICSSLHAGDTVSTTTSTDRGSCMFVDLSCLSCLPSLEIALLILKEPALVKGLGRLSSLQTLHLHSSVPMALPVSRTYLAIRGSEAIWDEAAWFKAVLSKALDAVSLSSFTLPMQLLDNDPSELALLPGIQRVSELDLTFSLWEAVDPTSWCSGFFTQLQTIDLAFDRCSLVASPEWDFSQCPGLKNFTLTILGIRDAVPLEQLKHVSCELLVVEFKGWPCSFERLGLLCGTWTVAQAQVCYDQKDQEELPHCVSDVLGALQSAKGGPPSILVNDKTPTAAAAAAAANAPSAGRTVM